MPHLLHLLLIALGGAVGALLRYLVSVLGHRLLGGAFPWGTLAVNLLGCFLIGFLWALSERLALPRYAGPLLFTGMLGAFTTFSTYGLESFRLLRSGEVGLGLANILMSNVGGLLLVLLGFLLAQQLAGLPSPGSVP